VAAVSEDLADVDVAGEQLRLDDLLGAVRCEACGAAIDAGRLCLVCMRRRDRWPR